jgi:uncharacterized protein YcbK (DUF882 family)
MNQNYQSPDGVKMPIPVAENLSHLAYAVDILEEHLNKKVNVLKGYVSPNLCLKEKIPNSPHCYGKAVEISIDDMPIEQVADALENLMHCEDIPNGKIKKLKKSVYYETY